MTYTPHFPPCLRAEVELPSSKSLSNRALLLAALSGPEATLDRPADCDDTRVVWHALHDRPFTIDILAAGTAMRFLTAYFALCPGEVHVLTGTERMRSRPIGVLVDALRALGAAIAYEGREGFPPLRVEGRQLEGGEVAMQASVSSQYISALLMIAPLTRRGLTLRLEGEVVSRPYIDMTLALMRESGARAGWTGAQTLRVEPGSYRREHLFEIESDWSAASYWYAMVALSPDPAATVSLRYLRADSLQGDRVVRSLFEPLGVSTELGGFSGRACLRKRPLSPDEAAQPVEADLSACPDLAQTLVVACAFLRRPFRFTGLRTLRIKETDRLAALQAELRKFGAEATVEGDEAIYIKDYPPAFPAWNGQPVATYHDHRMALSFAPAALRCPGFSIADPGVVSKSYPQFWSHLESLLP